MNFRPIHSKANKSNAAYLDREQRQQRRNMNHRSLFLFSGEQQSEAEWPTWKTHRSTNNFPPHNHRYQLPLGTWYMEESTNFCLQTDLHIIPIRSSIPVATTTNSARSYIWPNKPRAHWTMVAEPSPQNQIGEAAIEPRTTHIESSLFSGMKRSWLCFILRALRSHKTTD